MDLPDASLGLRPKDLNLRKDFKISDNVRRSTQDSNSRRPARMHQSHTYSGASQDRPADARSLIADTASKGGGSVSTFFIPAVGGEVAFINIRLSVTGSKDPAIPSGRHILYGVGNS